jgi:hypothetical protein
MAIANPGPATFQVVGPSAIHGIEHTTTYWTLDFEPFEIPLIRIDVIIGFIFIIADTLSFSCYFPCSVTGFFFPHNINLRIKKMKVTRRAGIKIFDIALNFPAYYASWGSLGPHGF